MFGLFLNTCLKMNIFIYVSLLSGGFKAEEIVQKK